VPVFKPLFVHDLKKWHIKRLKNKQRSFLQRYFCFSVQVEEKEAKCHEQKSFIGHKNFTVDYV